MSTLDKQHFVGMALTDKERAKHIGVLHRLTSKQKVAASLAADHMGQVLFDGVIGDLFLVVEAAVGAGESMTFDVLKNGVSILSGVFTLDSTDVVTAPISLKSLVTAAGGNFLCGDTFTVTREYTAGGGPTPMAGTTVVLEPSVSPYLY